MMSFPSFLAFVMFVLVLLVFWGLVIAITYGIALPLSALTGVSIHLVVIALFCMMALLMYAHGKIHAWRYAKQVRELTLARIRLCWVNPTENPDIVKVIEGFLWQNEYVALINIFEDQLDAFGLAGKAQTLGSELHLVRKEHFDPLFATTLQNEDWLDPVADIYVSLTEDSRALTEFATTKAKGVAVELQTGFKLAQSPELDILALHYLYYQLCIVYRKSTSIEIDSLLNDIQKVGGEVEILGRSETKP